MTASAPKRVIVEFPGPLYAMTEEAVQELGMSRSELIRSAVERYLSDLKQERFEREMAEGYSANAALDRRICADFHAGNSGR